MQEVPHIHSTCETCGGRIYAQSNVIRTHYTGAWLHLRAEDWQANVHDATPQAHDAKQLVDAIMADPIKITSR